MHHNLHWFWGQARAAVACRREGPSQPGRVRDGLGAALGGVPGWGSFSDDTMCLAGADAASVGLGTFGPGALGRGGNFIDGTAAGVFSVFGLAGPTGFNNRVGFRCAR